MKTTDPVNPATPTFQVKFHVENYNANTGKLKGTPLNTDGTTNPHPLSGYKEVDIPQADRAKLQGIKNCDNIYIDLTMSNDGDNTPTGSNIRRVHKDAVNSYKYDIAANPPAAPSPTLIHTVVPEVTLTNVGETAMDFSVEVGIVKTPELSVLINWSLQDESNDNI